MQITESDVFLCVMLDFLGRVLYGIDIRYTPIFSDCECLLDLTKGIKRLFMPAVAQLKYARFRFWFASGKFDYSIWRSYNYEGYGVFNFSAVCRDECWILNI